MLCMARSELNASAAAGNVMPLRPNPVERYSAFAVQLPESGISTPAPAAHPNRHNSLVSTVPGAAKPLKEMPATWVRVT